MTSNRGWILFRLLRVAKAWQLSRIFQHAASARWSAFSRSGMRQGCEQEYDATRSSNHARTASSSSMDDATGFGLVKIRPFRREIRTVGIGVEPWHGTARPSRGPIKWTQGAANQSREILSSRSLSTNTINTKVSTNTIVQSTIRIASDLIIRVAWVSIGIYKQEGDAWRRGRCVPFGGMEHR